MIISNKILYLIIIPFGISFTISIILRFIKSNIVIRLGYISSILSIIVSYFLYFSFPDWPINKKQILSFIIIFSGLSGILIDLITNQISLLRRVLIVAGPLLALVWINSIINTELSSFEQIFKFVISFIIFIIIGFSLADKDPEDSQISVILAMFIMGLGILANINDIKEIFSLSIIIFSALIGIQLTNWPKKFITNSSLLLGIGTPILSILAILSINQKVNPFAILVLLIILFIEKIIKLPSGINKSNSIISYAMIIISSLIIIFASISIQTNYIYKLVEL
ncbi:MAG: hypothetical protein CFH01_01000 [Alphaproteobacteria bacterium MarineAlpha2_Bin1]|nr:MAG: hypothetical protein CFH01_01000 [Alphaproteobacteria bacterium MarineAlpha2_Bin1]|tara:strand:+ start:1120 stop:1965 length:846 start_codon:yes stop_codon:yes gene_type:complete